MGQTSKAYRPPHTYRLSPLQQGMLFHSLADAESGAYVGHIACKLPQDPRRQPV